MSGGSGSLLGSDRISELLRRRGPRSDTAASRTAPDPAEADRIVQRTDDDAAQARLSAVRAGYLEDEFASQLVPNEHQMPARFPIINRGTYLRTTAIDRLVHAFLDQGSPASRKQIISLGAGSDTRFFRLASSGRAKNVLYHELDFPEVTRKKVHIIGNSPTLFESLDQVPNDLKVDREAGSIYSSTYNLHPLDLRTVKPQISSADGHDGRTVVGMMTNVDLTIETLIISECCLIYFTPEQADNVVKYFTFDLFPPETPLMFAIYEPIRGDDAFGKVMTQNLAARGIVLRTLEKYATLEAQKTRLRLLGLTTAQNAVDINEVLRDWIPDVEKARLSKLEMLDEVEEWELLASHYCIAWGCRGIEIDSAL